MNNFNFLLLLKSLVTKEHSVRTCDILFIFELSLKMFIKVI